MIALLFAQFEGYNLGRPEMNVIVAYGHFDSVSAANYIHFWSVLM